MPMVCEFKSNLPDVQAASRAQIVNWLHAIGLDASSTAAEKAPHKTGALRNSISYAVDDSALEAYIGTNLYYAVYQELGTSKIAGKHFLQFGATAHSSEYKDLLEQYLKG